MLQTPKRPSGTQSPATPWSPRATAPAISALPSCALPSIYGFLPSAEELGSQAAPNPMERETQASMSHRASESVGHLETAFPSAVPLPRWKGESWVCPVKAQMQGVCSLMKQLSPSPSQNHHYEPGPFLIPCSWEL